MKLCLFCNFQTDENINTCPKDGSSLVLIGDDPILGLVLDGRYKVESLIGQGAAGAVYKGFQEVIGREVAIKILHDYLVSDDEFSRRFIQEAKACSRLSHPNILTIYDFGIIPKVNRPYMVMEYLQGTSLADLIIDSKRLDYKTAIPIFIGVAQALAEAHRQGIVHRDIKPDNVVLVERGEEKMFPILVDFGIARLSQEDSESNRITKTGTVCGSPTYMSPEQCVNSRVGPSSDIYSLGIVIFETLTGEVPFLSEQVVKVMSMHLSTPPPKINSLGLNVKFPVKLEEIVDKMLAKDPNDRFKSMDEVVSALNEIQNLKNEEEISLAQAITGRPKLQPPPPNPLENLINKDYNVDRKDMAKFVSKEEVNITYGSLPDWNTMISPVDKLAEHTPEADFNYDINSVIQPENVQPAIIENPKTSDPSSLSAKDLALKRLEELSKNAPPPSKPQIPNIVPQANQGGQPNSIESNEKTSPSKGLSRLREETIDANYIKNQVNAKNNFAKYIKIAFFGLLTVALVGTAAYFVTSKLISSKNEQQYTNQIDNLITQGKYDECCALMEQLNSEGKLDAKGLEQMHSLYIRIAKNYAKSQKFEDALETLDEIPATSKKYDIAQKLKTKYLAQLEQMPEEQDNTTNSHKILNK